MMAENEAQGTIDKSSEERNQTEDQSTMDPDKEIPFKKRKHAQMDTEEPSNKKNRTEKNEIQITGKETEEEFLEKVLRLEDEVMAEAETENGNNTYQNQPIRKEIQNKIKKEPVEEEEKETESDPDDPEKIVELALPISPMHSVISFIEYLSMWEWLFNSLKSCTTLNPCPCFLGTQKMGEL